MDREFRLACKRSENKYLNNIFEEIEQYAKYKLPQELYDKVEYSSRDFKPEDYP